MAIKKIGEGKFIKLFGWAARSATASDNTIKFPHLKALLDNSDANKPARFIILTNLEALAALGREMTENDLLYDFYKHLREVFREWCDSKGYPQPEEFFFAAPVVKNSALDANERGVFFSIRGGWNVCYVKLVSRMHVSQPLRRRRGSCRFCTMPGGKKEIFQGRLPWLTPGPAQCKSFP
ncbi:uncharacterized protein LY89DRAFT_691793 [Mollisia scopiformis]|uniref:Uncharacterized protein n=1 Tax=Mollisia scopiformis TaxID=149040 RepID=A0A132B6M5_MOLSC|nr:uncharacterized protein LY89DRAFT_691793 [Mollisia scopiformis]KUJ07327.1 hypothetical protein LY89DRAFT_691793 [Mollisia scopiformis]